jgi:hypothetical protein
MPINPDWLAAQSEQEDQEDYIQMMEMDETDWRLESVLMSSSVSSSAIPSPSPTFTPEVFLQMYSISAIRKTVNLFFCIVYGLFPVSTVSAIREYLKRGIDLGDGVSIGGVDGGISKVVDPFDGIRQRVLEMDVIDESLLVNRRFAVRLEIFQLPAQKKITSFSVLTGSIRNA